LLAKFSAVDGVGPSDRGVFVRGLYDGMMNETRRNGERLPGRMTGVKVRKSARAGKLAVAEAPGLRIHPYSLGLGLGRQVRFSVPLDKITAELEEQVQRQLKA
jgi:hypothetical protein